uniref:Uncharacterized protein n=1 Tax=Nelumbo nucifera TaxID=4432 RepID=A0A822ZMT2_NELNU|nr:TPA_asm: hypothetical protein HUJ06_017261 [Nelumbo nucifera]
MLDDDMFGGNDEDKVLMGFLDESKDQVMSESSILLSPQWLYVKTSETKTGPSSPSGESENWQLEEANCTPLFFSFFWGHVIMRGEERNAGASNQLKICSLQ